jgi:hypothetical protein
MALPNPSPERALAQLADTTAELRRAVEADDVTIAARAAARRQTEIEALRLALERRPLDERRLEQLAAILRGGAESARLLAARRAESRTQLAELEAQRHRLAAWIPKQPERAGRLELQA